jgi:hypothetical protein
MGNNNMYMGRTNNFSSNIMPNEYFNGNYGYSNEVDGNYSDPNSSKKSSNGECSTKKGDDSYIVEMFGKRGWICDSCNNFNYESIIY